MQQPTQTSRLGLLALAWCCLSFGPPTALSEAPEAAETPPVLLAALPGADVLDIAQSFADGGQYKWVPGNSGSPIALKLGGEQLLAKGDGTFCCGFTLAVAFETAKARGLLTGCGMDDLRAFQRNWFGATQASGETQCVFAAETLGIGRGVPLDDARPGDFVQLWRTSGSGHSVVMLEPIYDAEKRNAGKLVGLRYRSSQGLTDGIGDREEYFSDVPGRGGSVLRERTYVCRLDAAMNPAPNQVFQRADALEADGRFAEAQALLRTLAGDPGSSPNDDSNDDANDGATDQARDEALWRIERQRRVRLDFPLTTDQVLAQVRETLPDVTLADLVHWRDAGDLQYRVIDGQPRYFVRAASNLFRFSADARERRDGRAASKAPSGAFDLTAHLAQLVELGESAQGPAVFPVKHTVRFALSVHEGHALLRPGAVVRAWLPFPQEYRQQGQVRLLRSEPPHRQIAPNGSPHRSVFFEQTLADPPVAPRFELDFEFTTSAWRPDLDPAKALPYDTSSELYREHTAPRPSHIAITDDVSRLAQQIVAGESNPLEKARRVFRWVSAHVEWCAEMEYGTIDSLSAKGLAARRGDCGVQGTVFVTLCRAAGVPARWQSGWQLQPGGEGMHDWSEIYLEPWGWLPADASYGVRNHPDPRVQDFLLGGTDPYRMIVNLDYARPLFPAKTGPRSEPNDFQRGEVEIDGQNLYFDGWDWEFQVDSQRLE